MTERKVYKLKKVDKPFVCSKCNNGFKQKEHLEKHLNRVNACDATYICNKCGKSFDSDSILKRHLNRKTPCSIEEIPVITNNNEENRCHLCNKTFATASSLKRHQKNVCNTSNPQISQQIINLLLEKDQQRDEREKKLLEIIEKNGLSSTINNNTTNITNVQQNIYMNVTICCFGDEDLSRLDKNKVMELLKNHEKDFMSKMIEYIHANPDMPELHNVFYDPIKNKAIVFAPISENEKSWQSCDFKIASEKMTQQIKEHVMPGNGPYFDMAMKEKDYDTSNAIIRIAKHTNWNTPETLEQNRNVLSKLINDKNFRNLVELLE